MPSNDDQKPKNDPARSPEYPWRSFPSTPVYPPWSAWDSALDRARASAARRVVTMGWHPDLPDFRDKTPGDKKIRGILKSKSPLIAGSGAVPKKADNREWCSPVEDQGRLGSCTAQAVVGLMEYMINRSGGDPIDGSRLFTYKVTRNLLGWTGDRGAYLRTAMQSVAAFGVPPERHWPYDIERFDEEPSAFLYSYADNYKALDYARLDPAGAEPGKVLESLKRVLASGLCVVFGFSVYSSLSGKPDIPFPAPTDSLRGGHAVVAVGYDDEHEIEDQEKKTVVPSLLIRNSWGTVWGEGGYGYLPYDFVLKGLARDFWTTFKWDWIDTGQFKGPAGGAAGSRTGSN